MNFKYFFLVLFMLSSCKKNTLDEKILGELFPGRNFAGVYPKIIFEESKSISSDGNISQIFLLRDKNEEYLVTIQNQTLVFYNRFVMQNYGPYRYETEIKNFLPESRIDPSKSYIIKNIEFIQLENDTFYSIFIDILSEEPPMGLFQVPLVYREGIKIFDGLNLLTEEKFLKDWKYSRFSLINSNTLLIYSPHGLEKKYVWKNGSFNLSLQASIDE